MAEQVRALRVNPADDVAVMLADGRAGDMAVGDHVEQTLEANISRGHKVALRAVGEGEPVRRYGQIIGFAAQAIAPGEHVHTHNLTLRAYERDYAFGRDAHPLPPAESTCTFMGYARGDGRVGTRNTVLVIAASNCAASVARKIAAAFDDDALAAYPNVDAVAPVAHWSGCAIGLGEELACLRRALGGVAQHPNVAGYVLVSLGCEANQLDGFIADAQLQLPVTANPTAISIQEAGGVGPAVQAGIAAVRELLALANRHRRTEQPVSKLNVALECGGSDSYSGLTANPVAGAAADLVVAQGGTAVFGETPEIFGAEHTLTRRAVSAKVGEALLEHIRWWEGYAARNGVTLDNNPSPGNKAGGLTTIYEKSLGAVSKAGHTPLAAVYQYAEPVTSSGLCFMDTPGYDPPSVVGMVAGGANLVIFTTGRGSAFGLQPVPVIKVATNTPLAARMPDIIDLDAGRVLSAGASIQQTGEALFDLLLAVASGERTRAEINGVGEDEFVPWIPGAVL